MTKMSISERLAIFTGAERENLLLSATNTTRRACSMIAREDFDLVHVEVEQRSVGVDGRGADDGEIDAEFLDLRHRDRADDAAVALTDRAAGHDHLYRRVAIEFAGDVEIVGDHQQAGMPAQRLGDFLRRRADVDQQRGVVGHEAGRRLADPALGLVRDQLARLVGEIGDARRDHRAAMHPHQRVGLAQFVQVAPDGLQRDAEMRRQLLDADAAGLAQHRKDFRLPIVRRFRRRLRHDPRPLAAPTLARFRPHVFAC